MAPKTGVCWQGFLQWDGWIFPLSCDSEGRGEGDSEGAKVFQNGT
jgi:hypothetical protein